MHYLFIIRREATERFLCFELAACVQLRQTEYSTKTDAKASSLVFCLSFTCSSLQNLIAFRNREVSSATIETTLQNLRSSAFLHSQADQSLECGLPSQDPFLWDQRLKIRLSWHKYLNLHYRLRYNRNGLCTFSANKCLSSWTVQSDNAFNYSCLLPRPRPSLVTTF